MTVYRQFSHYFEMCKRHKVRVEILMAKHHMNLLMQSFKDLYFKDANLDEFRKIADEYKLSFDGILEIFVMGRFMELMQIDELKKQKRKLN